MSITASQVNELRKKTGAGMMDCKNALVESNGDMEQAIDLLRKKGQKIAAKRGDNEAKEGLVFAETSADDSFGVLVALNCETDFVAKNDDFRNFVQSIVNVALSNKATSIDDLKSMKFDDKLTIEEKIIEQIGVIGEKLDLSKYEIVHAPCVVAYNHPGNQLATLVALNKAGDVAANAGKQVAMQVAAMNPIALNQEGVDAITIQREIEIGKELAIQEGKPEDMALKIAEGRLGKFFKENTLLSQPFVRDNKLTVEQFLKQEDKELIAVDFRRIALSN
jgi:elongation factor Ts